MLIRTALTGPFLISARSFIVIRPFMRIIISPNCDLDFSSQIFRPPRKRHPNLFNRQQRKQSSRYKILVSFCNAGGNAVLKDWVANGMKEKPRNIPLIWDAAKLGIFLSLEDLTGNPEELHHFIPL